MPDFSAKYYNPTTDTVSALPYYIQNGSFVTEAIQMTDDQLELLGWIQLTLINPEYDTDIQYIVSQVSTKSLKRLENVYAFKSDARDQMIKKIDEQAERLRGQIATSQPLQTMEYQQAYNQAIAYNTIPTSNMNDWPFLTADIGNTLMSNGQIVQTLQQSADCIIFAQNQWFIAASIIRLKRLSAKAAIRDADSLDEAFAAYQSAWN